MKVEKTSYRLYRLTTSNYGRCVNFNTEVSFNQKLYSCQLCAEYTKGWHNKVYENSEKDGVLVMLSYVAILLCSVGFDVLK